MKTLSANIKYASKKSPSRFERKRLVFYSLSTLLLIGLLISPAAAAAVDWKITPTNPVVGDTLKMTGTASPGTNVRAEVTYVKSLPVSNGRYQLSLYNLQVPGGKDNRFTVTVDGVKNLRVKVKKLVWFPSLNKDAENGVATISQGSVPAWTYDIVIDGDAKSKSPVQLKVMAAQTLTADSKGKFSFNYDTSALPAGTFNVKIGDQAKTIELKAKGQKQSQASSTKSSVIGIDTLKDKFADLGIKLPGSWNL